MTKKLAEMTLEELWQLFPIELVEHKKDFATWYAEEIKEIEKYIPNDYIFRINHIGSSAVEGLLSKKTVDILLEVHAEEQFEKVLNLLNGNDWNVMSKSCNEAPRATLNKGYTETGYAERVYHLHLRLKCDWAELYFRDYLQSNKLIASEYEKLKIMLAKKYKNNRDEYTKQKTDFINEHSHNAKVIYGKRYTP